MAAIAPSSPMTTNSHSGMASASPGTSPAPPDASSPAVGEAVGVASPSDGSTDGVSKGSRSPCSISSARLSWGLRSSTVGTKVAPSVRGVGSNLTHPMPGNRTSTHAWASLVETIHVFCVRNSSSARVPGRNPTETRVGMLAVRSITAMAVAKYSQ